MNRIPIWFEPRPGMRLRNIDKPEVECTVLAVGRKLRRTCFEGDRAISIRDHSGVYVSITSCWEPLP